MPEESKELLNLARIGKLAAEPGTPGEIKGLLTSGSERLADAVRAAVTAFDVAGRLTRELHLPREGLG